MKPFLLNSLIGSSRIHPGMNPRGCPFHQHINLFAMVIHNSLPDFILFVYVHMSEADHNYDPNEMAVIQGKMAALFPNEVDFEKKLYTTIREYNAFDKSNLNELFQDSFDHFAKDEFKQKNQLYHDLQEIIMADGKIEQSEAKALNALKEIIDLNTR